MLYPLSTPRPLPFQCILQMTLLYILRSDGQTQNCASNTALQCNVLFTRHQPATHTDREHWVTLTLTKNWRGTVTSTLGAKSSSNNDGPERLSPPSSSSPTTVSLSWSAALTHHCVPQSRESRQPYLATTTTKPENNTTQWQHCMHILSLEKAAVMTGLERESTAMMQNTHIEKSSAELRPTTSRPRTRYANSTSK